MTTTIYFVRHGETIWNTEKRMQGSLNSALTSNGEKQARLLGEALQYEKIDRLYTSPAPRAIQTITPIANNFKKKYSIIDDLRELDMGSWEGKTYQEIQKEFPEESKNFWNDHTNYQALNGGETFHALISRSIRALSKILQESNGKNILIVSHRMTIRFLLSELLKLPLEKIPDLKSTSLSKIIKDDSDFHVEFLNQIMYSKGNLLQRA